MVGAALFIISIFAAIARDTADMALNTGVILFTGALILACAERTPASLPARWPAACRRPGRNPAGRIPGFGRAGS